MVKQYEIPPPRLIDSAMTYSSSDLMPGEDSGAASSYASDCDASLESSITVFRHNKIRLADHDHTAINQVESRPVEYSPNSADIHCLSQSSDEQMRGEVIEVGDSEAECWIAISPTVQLKVTVELGRFPHAKVRQGTEFLWDPKKDKIFEAADDDREQFEAAYKKFMQEFPEIKY